MGPNRKPTIDDLLRRSRPETPARLLRELTGLVALNPQRGLRLRGMARAGVLTAAVIVALAFLGGLGYAMSIATDLVVTAKSYKSYAVQTTLRQNRVNAALDQYGTTGTTTTTTTQTTTTATTATTTTTTATTTETATTTLTATTTATGTITSTSTT